MACPFASSGPVTPEESEGLETFIRQHKDLLKRHDDLVFYAASAPEIEDLEEQIMQLSAKLEESTAQQTTLEVEKTTYWEENRDLKIENTRLAWDNEELKRKLAASSDLLAQAHAANQKLQDQLATALQDGMDVIQQLGVQHKTVTSGTPPACGFFGDSTNPMSACGFFGDSTNPMSPFEADLQCSKLSPASASSLDRAFGWDKPNEGCGEQDQSTVEATSPLPSVLDLSQSPVDLSTPTLFGAVSPTEAHNLMPAAMPGLLSSSKPRPAPLSPSTHSPISTTAAGLSTHMQAGVSANTQPAMSPLSQLLDIFLNTEDPTFMRTPPPAYVAAMMIEAPSATPATSSSLQMTALQDNHQALSWDKSKAGLGARDDVGGDATSLLPSRLDLSWSPSNFLAATPPAPPTANSGPSTIQDALPETEAVPGLLSNLSSSVMSPLSQAPIPSPVAKLSAHPEVEVEGRQLPVGPLTQLLLEELPTTDNPSFMETPRPAMLIGMPSTPYFPSLTASAQANLQALSWGKPQADFHGDATSPVPSKLELSWSPSTLLVSTPPAPPTANTGARIILDVLPEMGTRPSLLPASNLSPIPVSPSPPVPMFSPAGGLLSHTPVQLRSAQPGLSPCSNLLVERFRGVSMMGTPRLVDFDAMLTELPPTAATRSSGPLLTASGNHQAEIPATVLSDRACIPAEDLTNGHSLQALSWVKHQVGFVGDAASPLPAMQTPTHADLEAALMHLPSCTPSPAPPPSLTLTAKANRQALSWGNTMMDSGDQDYVAGDAASPLPSMQTPHPVEIEALLMDVPFSFSPACASGLTLTAKANSQAKVSARVSGARARTPLGNVTNVLGSQVANGCSPMPTCSVKEKGFSNILKAAVASRPSPLKPAAPLPLPSPAAALPLPSPALPLESHKPLSRASPFDSPGTPPNADLVSPAPAPLRRSPAVDMQRAQVDMPVCTTPTLAAPASHATRTEVVARALAQPPVDMTPSQSPAELSSSNTSNRSPKDSCTKSPLSPAWSIAGPNSPAVPTRTLGRAPTAKAATAAATRACAQQTTLCIGVTTRARASGRAGTTPSSTNAARPASQPGTAASTARTAATCKPGQSSIAGASSRGGQHAKQAAAQAGTSHLAAGVNGANRRSGRSQASLTAAASSPKQSVNAGSNAKKPAATSAKQSAARVTSAAANCPAVSRTKAAGRARAAGRTKALKAEVPTRVQPSRAAKQGWR